MTYLKEVAVPYFDYAAYKDGSTFLSKLGLAMTIRPTVGVYQWLNNITCIRPLPTAAEDQRLPSPSLIFHCESPENNEDKIREHGFREARIGYGGLGRDRGHGQVMLLHKDLIGLDIRYCPRTKIQVHSRKLKSRYFRALYQNFNQRTFFLPEVRQMMINVSVMVTVGSNSRLVSNDRMGL